MITYNGLHNYTYQVGQNLRDTIAVGKKVVRAKYMVNDNDEITFKLPIINAIDIDWNNVYLPSLNTYINSTEDLLYQLETIYNAIGNIDNLDLSNYVTKDELDNKGYLSKSLADTLYADKSVEHNIEELQDALTLKADISSIPTHINDLQGYQNLATQQWVNSQLSTYSKSAYDIAVDNGYVGSESDWLASLHGTNGIDGKSAYEIYLQNGGTIPTESQWIASLQGANGWSAYQIAYSYDSTIGTEQEWLNSLQGATGTKGEDGKSAYEIAKEAGYVGTESEWLESLKGAQGEKGEKGDRGASINIKGTFDSLEELNAATEDTFNAIGDAYIINGDCYVYNELSETDPSADKWINSGRVQGPAGKSAYEIYRDIQIALGQEYLSESDWINNLSNARSYTAGRGITISEDGIISNTLTASEMWTAFNE